MRRDGFTLVELLLGLAIAAIIGLSVYNMFWSAMKLDDKMRRIHDNYLEILIADQELTRDLENAISLDLSASFPDAHIFDGQKNEFSFLTQTPDGIKRVRYYSGMIDSGNVTKSLIGRVINPQSRMPYAKGLLPIEFLIRQESSLADWENEEKNDTRSQIVAAGLKKDSFTCRYAPYSKDLQSGGLKAIAYEDSWDKSNLPLVVSCSFVLYDPKIPQAGLKFKRDIFLAPVANN